METERSYEEALAVVRERFEEREIEELAEETAMALETSLVESVFGQAWRYQFDEDRGNFKRETRSIVENAIEKVGLDEVNNAS